MTAHEKLIGDVQLLVAEAHGMTACLQAYSADRDAGPVASALSAIERLLKMADDLLSA